MMIEDFEEEQDWNGMEFGRFGWDREVYPCTF